MYLNWSVNEMEATSLVARKKSRAAGSPLSPPLEIRKQEVNFRLHSNRVTLQQDTIMGP